MTFSVIFMNIILCLSVSTVFQPYDRGCRHLSRLPPGSATVLDLQLYFSGKIQFLRKHGLEGRRLFLVWHHRVGIVRLVAECYFAVHSSQQASYLHLVSMLTENLCDGGDERRTLRRVAKSVKTRRRAVCIEKISFFRQTIENCSRTAENLSIGDIDTLVILRTTTCLNSPSRMQVMNFNKTNK